MAEKKTPFGGKQAAPFGKGGKQAEDDDKAKKAPAKKATAKKK